MLPSAFPRRPVYSERQNRGKEASWPFFQTGSYTMAQRANPPARRVSKHAIIGVLSALVGIISVLQTKFAAASAALSDGGLWSGPGADCLVPDHPLPGPATVGRFRRAVVDVRHTHRLSELYGKRSVA